MDLPRRLQEQLYHAACFSLAVNGAPLLYNLMLEEMTGAEPEVPFRERLRTWADEIEGSRALFARWERIRQPRNFGRCRTFKLARLADPLITVEQLSRFQLRNRTLDDLRKQLRVDIAQVGFEKIGQALHHNAK